MILSWVLRSRAHLAVVKSAIDSDVVDVVVEDGGHLRLLDRRDTALGMEDKDRNVLLRPQAIDRSAVARYRLECQHYCTGRAAGYAPARVARSRADDRDALASLAGLLLGVAALEEELEQVAEELEGDVLKRERWAVEELEDPALVADLVDGRDVVMPEGRVALLDQAAQLVV